MNDNYKRMCKLVTAAAEHNKLSENRAMQLFTQNIHLNKLLLNNNNFLQEIWENTTEEFKATWVTTKDEEIDKLVVLFANQ